MIDLLLTKPHKKKISKLKKKIVNILCETITQETKFQEIKNNQYLTGKQKKKTLKRLDIYTFHRSHKSKQLNRLKKGEEKINMKLTKNRSETPVQNNGDLKMNGWIWMNNGNKYSGGIIMH